MSGEAIGYIFFFGIIAIVVFICYMIAVCIESKHEMKKNIHFIKIQLEKIELMLIAKSLGVKTDATE